MDYQNEKIQKIEKVEQKIKSLQKHLSRNYPNKKRWKKHVKVFNKYETSRSTFEEQIMRSEILKKEVDLTQREIKELEIMIEIEKQKRETIMSNLEYLDTKINEMSDINAGLVRNMKSSSKIKEEIDQKFALSTNDLSFSGSMLKLNLEKSEGDSSFKDDTTSTTEEEEEESNS